MPLPWVSRDAYEDLREARNHERTVSRELRIELATLTDRYELLTTRYHELRLAGNQVPLPVAVPATGTAARVDVVTAAVIQMSRGSAVLRRQLSEYANEQRVAGASEKDIAEAIIEGIPDEQGVPE